MSCLLLVVVLTFMSLVNGQEGEGLLLQSPMQSFLDRLRGEGLPLHSPIESFLDRLKGEGLHLQSPIDLFLDRLKLIKKEGELEILHEEELVKKEERVEILHGAELVKKEERVEILHGAELIKKEERVEILHGADGGSVLENSQDQTSRSAWTPGADCDRKCGGPSLICYFYFILERYSVLSGACANCSSGVQEDCFLPQCIPADGISKPMLSINRTLPGPAIVVCKGDTVIVDVDNSMVDLSTTIHWHGIKQKGTPYMDGVPYVTQCPINPSSIFRYRFEVPDAGTYLYHAHEGLQKQEGLLGALIIRDMRSQEQFSNLYDMDLTEHVILVQDWLHTTAYYWSPGPHLAGVTEVPAAILINGIGPLWVNGSNNFVPMARFRVKQGLRFRFRLIGGTCMYCNYVLTIQGHKLTVITTDGGLNIEPIIVNSISITSGDRFDFVLTANNQVGSYYIIVESVTAFCGLVRQIAVLEYEGSNSGLTMPPPLIEDFGVVLNPPDSPCNGSRPNEICVSDLIGKYDAPAVFGTNAAYQQIPVQWGFLVYHDPQRLFTTFQSFEEPVYQLYLRHTLNNITYRSPPSPFLTQFNDIPKEAFCSPECKKNTLENACSCINYYSIEEGSIVDFIILDTIEEYFNHPFHLHGHNFYVLKIGEFPSLDPVVVHRVIEELKYNASHDLYSLQSLPMKDTITTPASGYVVIRFIADNPGWWLLHCHFVFHVESGMQAVLRIGEVYPPAPPNFPKCGNFLPV